jgi:anti-anti-sigma factor
MEAKFTGYCAGESPRVLVDVSDVDYLASIGIRLFMINAKSLASRNGRMVLVKPVPEVRKILEITGVPSVIPVYDGLESAEVALLQG